MFLWSWTSIVLQVKYVQVKLNWNTTVYVWAKDDIFSKKQSKYYSMHSLSITQVLTNIWLTDTCENWLRWGFQWGLHKAMKRCKQGAGLSTDEGMMCCEMEISPHPRQPDRYDSIVNTSPRPTRPKVRWHNKCRKSKFLNVVDWISCRLLGVFRWDIQWREFLP